MPWVKTFDPNVRGYVRCDVTRDRLIAEARIIASREEPVTPMRTLSTWEVTAGVPGVRQV